VLESRMLRRTFGAKELMEKISYFVCFDTKNLEKIHIEEIYDFCSSPHVINRLNQGG
jgi:hypothetical protein